MNCYDQKTRKIERSKIDLFCQRVEEFVENWQETFEPDWIIGEGKIENIQRVHYIIHENLYSVFVSDYSDFIELSSAVLGDALVDILQFEWCEIKLSGFYTVGLKNYYNDLLIPIREMIIHRLSGRPQCGGLEHLFFDILFSAHFWKSGFHPLSGK